MRNLRWAAEKAVSTDQRTADLGLQQLRTLARSPNDPEQQSLIDAALDSVYASVELELTGEDGQGAVVVVRSDSASDIASGLDSATVQWPRVTSEEEEGEDT